MTEEKVTVRIGFLLHTYVGNDYYGQKLMIKEITNTPQMIFRFIAYFLDLLSRQKTIDNFKGTMDYPTESETFRTLKSWLGDAYLEIEDPEFYDTDPHVRVMQIFYNTEIADPDFPNFIF
ncbi:hypothetical protein COT97_05360 [Candidatus Falkowbacteria bacterium CG10_big_fil_rev_8_21_14_0_10_39_11]|uniref:Uncharacterized protein n=1 Tax=Candidatus Falkowbacteria bacterium CG10_big_fil_rev_8_21_14_0_10_39_11 TaxID=1974565 RepID=A0A2H0V3K1_9BACT|nr:MAG: hypothetical protein COT97_05360 [Candidatus Falkowbacteria bacterium CG10_big_fil_rev_8_21_14_0_10_39_11]